ncbi:hypothetical protein [Deminuibacter soli]|uniref:Uncharacterized protein n=1 Tax=Deminuibacter soli TaxID=2291815 RepID=A0A3E1NE41_9BACT|nr:hypothetical protein [Deminuibacter soli]RFM26239.1 hypothetical protein DXN05_20210 [Deminuibacter soli]
MTAIPRYLVCDNFMDDEDGEYVLHTQAPKFLARWNDDTETFDIVAEYDNISEHFGGDKEKLISFMEEMVNWYEDYDEWLEENVDEA